MADCYWIRDTKSDGDPIWQTTCGAVHEFIDGTPKENDHKYCPYCGDKITASSEQTASEGQTDD